MQKSKPRNHCLCTYSTFSWGSQNEEVVKVHTRLYSHSDFGFLSRNGNRDRVPGCKATIPMGHGITCSLNGDIVREGRGRVGVAFTFTTQKKDRLN